MLHKYMQKRPSYHDVLPLDLSLFLSQFLCLHLETRKKVSAKNNHNGSHVQKNQGGYDDTVHRTSHIHRNARLGTFLGVVVLYAAGL